MVGHLENSPHPDLLVGTATGDDAAVWRISADRAIISTADFITPVVDDARTWGRVAAANSVSDVFAMGGKPLFALNLVGWNTDELSTELLGEVLAGGDDVAREAGFAVVGGHTIDDPEPKYGMSVTGEVHPDHILTNAGLAPDQALILTKPLGIGIITTAMKAGKASPEAIERAVESMTFLNNVASEVAVAAGATGATDVTGFGLLGHLGRMARESSVDVELVVADIPFLDGAVELGNEGVVPGGTRRNLTWITTQVEAGEFDEVTQLLLADAQTSGGLIFGVNPKEVSGVLSRLADTGHTAAMVGSTTPGSGTIHLK